jgi:hypothetical protein
VTFVHSLQAKTCIVNLTSLSLMLFTSRPLFPMNVSYLSFMASERDHSPILWNSKDGSSPTFLNPVICAISAVSIETGGSSQSVPPWMQLSNTLTHALILLLHLKCGILNNLSIPLSPSLMPIPVVPPKFSPVSGSVFVHKY